MKKSNLNNLDLKKQSISNLRTNDVKGGSSVLTAVSCWTCISCTTDGCFTDEK